MARFCVSCGFHLEEVWRHCPKCGQASAESSSPSSASPKIQATPRARATPCYKRPPATGPRLGRNKPWSDLHFPSAWGARDLRRVKLLQQRSDSPSTGAGTPTQPAIAIPVPFPRSIQLGARAFTLSAGQYSYVHFTVAPGWSQVFVNGNFQAQGGSGNDVVALILDKDQLINWQNSPSTPTCYNSGQVTIGTIHAGPLPPGDYNLVFSNTFPLFANKAITANVKLEYLGL